MRVVYTTRQGQHRGQVSHLGPMVRQPYLVTLQRLQQLGGWRTVDVQRCERAGLAESIADQWVAQGGLEL